MNTGDFVNTGSTGAITGRSYSSGILSWVQNGTSFAVSVALVPGASSNFVVSKVMGDYVLSNAVAAPCFSRGTRIATPTGETAVEDLQIGDLVLTASGSAKPIKWIGRRQIDLTAHPQPEVVAPVRIQRDALAESVPHTDLLLSPDHGIFVDGKLIRARQLINGTTIRQEKGQASIEYFHIELGDHVILLAEGSPAESYLDIGNRGFFANADQPRVLHSDPTDESHYPDRAAGSCAPFVWDEATVRPAWQRLADRAAAIGLPVPQRATTTDPDLCLFAVCPGHRRFTPLYSGSNLAVFVLPRGVKEVVLASRAQSASEARPWLEDRRRLGVRVRRIILRGATELCEIPVDQPDLTKGWWAVERDGPAMSRWTDGQAILSLPEIAEDAWLEIHLAEAMTYVVDAEVSDVGQMVA